MKRLYSSYRLLLLAVTLVSMLSGCSKITHDVYVVNDAKKVGTVQPGDSAFAAF
jgi:outer membrane lipoprotein SlyB